MITLLSRLLIHPDGRDTAGLRQAYGILCGAAGIFLNVLLFAGKLLAGSLAGSVAITSPTPPPPPSPCWAFTWRDRRQMPITPSATGGSNTSPVWVWRC